MFVADTGGGEVGVDIGLQFKVVGRNDVETHAFLMESEKRKWPLAVVVGDLHGHRSGDARNP